MLAAATPSRPRNLRASFLARNPAAYEAVLADPHVEAVYISTPPSLHEEWVIKAAAAGKHVLCEKPAFTDLASAKKAVERCRAAGVRLLEGYAFKFHPQHAFVRSLIEQGRIGRPRLFAAEFTYPRPPENDIRLNPRLDGGVFRDSAGYPVAAALLHIAGRPVSLFCQISHDRATGVDNTVSLTMKFAGGEMAQLLAAFDVQYRSRYAVAGTLGRVEVERAFSVAPQALTTIALETGAGEEKFSLEPADQFCLMVDHFSAQVRGAAPGLDFEGDLLRQHALMDAAARSHREGRAVDLSEYDL